MNNAPAFDPTPLPSLPDLWEIAKQMFARMAGLRGWPRRDLLAWLIPVEQVVRAIVVAQALTRLLMEPARPRPAAPEAPRKSTMIPHPGWHTIARPWRAPEPAPEPDPAPARPRNRTFRVLVWRFAQWTPAPAAKGLPFKVLDVWGSRPAETAIPCEIETAASDPKSPGDIAGRIETLARVIANPEPTIRRIASYLARFPQAATEARAARFVKTANWSQGDYVYTQAVGQMRNAAGAFEKLEPG